MNQVQQRRLPYGLNRLRSRRQGLAVAAACVVSCVVVWLAMGSFDAQSAPGTPELRSSTRQRPAERTSAPLASSLGAWKATPIAPHVKAELDQFRWTARHSARAAIETQHPRRLLREVAAAVSDEIKRSGRTFAPVSAPPAVGVDGVIGALQPRIPKVDALTHVRDLSERSSEVPLIIFTVAESPLLLRDPDVRRVDELWRLQEADHAHLTVDREGCGDLLARHKELAKHVPRSIFANTTAASSAEESAAAEDLCRLLALYFIGGVNRDADLLWAYPISAIKLNVYANERGHGFRSTGPRPLAFAGMSRLHPCTLAALDGIAAAVAKGNTLAKAVIDAIAALASACATVHRLSLCDHTESHPKLLWAAEGWKSGRDTSGTHGYFGLRTLLHGTTTGDTAVPALSAFDGAGIPSVVVRQSSEASTTFPAPFPSPLAHDRNLQTWSSTAVDGVNDRFVIRFGDGLRLPWTVSTDRAQLHCVRVIAPLGRRFRSALAGVRVELWGDDNALLYRTSPVEDTVADANFSFVHTAAETAGIPAAMVRELRVIRSGGALRLAEVEVFLDKECQHASYFDIQANAVEFAMSSSNDPLLEVFNLARLMTRRTHDCPSTRMVSWSDIFEFVVCADAVPLVKNDCRIVTAVHEAYPYFVDEGLSLTSASNACKFVVLNTRPQPDNIKELAYTVLERRLPTDYHGHHHDITVAQIVKDHFGGKPIDILHIDYDGREAVMTHELERVSMSGAVKHLFIHFHLYNVNELHPNFPLHTARYAALMKLLLRYWDLIGSTVTRNSTTLSVMEGALLVPTLIQTSFALKRNLHGDLKVVPTPKPTPVPPAQMTFAPAADEAESDAAFAVGKLPYPETGTIPKVMHTIWKTDTLPAQGRKIDDTWREKEATRFEFAHHTDDECAKLARRFPVLGPRYDKLQLNVMKADICRLLVIYYEGGFYRDLDVRWVKPLDWVDFSAHAIYGNEDEHYCQWFFAARKGSPCIFNTLVHITRLLRNFKLDFHEADKDLVIEVTGPGAFTVGMQGCLSPPSLAPINMTQTTVWHEFAAMNWQSYASWLVQRDRLAGSRRMGAEDSARVDVFQSPSDKVLRPFVDDAAPLDVTGVTITSARYGGTLDVTPAHYAVDRNLDTYVVGTDSPEQAWTLSLAQPMELAKAQLKENRDTASVEALADVPLRRRLGCVTVHHRRGFTDQEHSNAVRVQLLDAEKNVICTTDELWRMRQTTSTLVVANCTGAQAHSVRVYKRFGTLLIAEVELSPDASCARAYRLVGVPTPELLWLPSVSQKWSWTAGDLGLRLMRTTVSCPQAVTPLMGSNAEYGFGVCLPWLRAAPSAVGVNVLATHIEPSDFNVMQKTIASVHIHRFSVDAECADDAVNGTTCLKNGVEVLDAKREGGVSIRVLVLDLDVTVDDRLFSWRILGQLRDHIERYGVDAAPAMVMIRWRYPMIDAGAVTGAAIETTSLAPGPSTTRLALARLTAILRTYEVMAARPVDASQRSTCRSAPIIAGAPLYECVDLSLVKKKFVHRH